jgi:hypothetical protein
MFALSSRWHPVHKPVFWDQWAFPSPFFFGARLERSGAQALGWYKAAAGKWSSLMVSTHGEH